MNLQYYALAPTNTYITDMGNINGELANINMTLRDLTYNFSVHSHLILSLTSTLIRWYYELNVCVSSKVVC